MCEFFSSTNSTLEGGRCFQRTASVSACTLDVKVGYPSVGTGLRVAICSARMNKFWFNNKKGPKNDEQYLIFQL